ncbi:L-glutamine:scyllo-inosose aminotransferase [subsurface metagenome]
MAIFSLNSTKNLPGGEGGLFVTNSEEYRGKANMVRMFGEYLRVNEGRKYMSYSMGWNYRTQELPAAFARSQLKRLEKYNATARRNGKYLSRQLEEMKGVIPPHVPQDRTTIYHKYRVRLDPYELEIDIDGVKFRDAVMEALQAEGVDTVLWQTVPIPGQPLFQLKQGYGKGCPWNCRHYQGEADYNVYDYPETVKLLNNSLVICSEPHPIYVQPLELIKYYLEAFRKVFDNIEQVIELATCLKPRKSVEGTVEIR